MPETTVAEGHSNVRKLESYIKKYGPNAGPKLYHALQSQAAHAGVSARLRRKIATITGETATRSVKSAFADKLPLFPEPVSQSS